MHSHLFLNDLGVCLLAELKMIRHKVFCIIILELPTNTIEIWAPWGQIDWALYGVNKAMPCCVSELAVQSQTLLGTWPGSCEPLSLGEAAFGHASAVGSPHLWADGGYHLADLSQLSLIFHRSLIVNTETLQL